MPALAEADDGFKYVLKFKGTGHGEKALIAELIGGEVARALGFKMPELVFAQLDEAFGRTEGDEEIQELLQKSQGMNLALHFLSGAITFDPVVTRLDAVAASRLVWLDAFITNIDRSARNTNMLIWNKELWLIDHGACLLFQHSWSDFDTQAKSPFTYIKDHVLLPQAAALDEANAYFKTVLNETLLKAIVALIPDEWLQWRDTDSTPQELRDIYSRFLITRLHHSEIFTKEAQHAREALI